MTLATIPHNQIIPTDSETRDYVESLELLLNGLSDNSRKAYEITYKLWRAFCDEQHISNLSLSPQNITAFLDNEQWSNNTRKARLAHLRRFLKALHSAMPTNPTISKWVVQMDEFIKPKNLGGAKDTRVKKAVTRTEHKEIMSVWLGDSNQAYRNLALMAILFYAGLRRFEVANLKWESIDLESGLIKTVAKGGEIKETSMLDGLQFVRDWRKRQQVYGQYTYVATPINKGDNITADKPITTMAMSKIVTATSKLSGVDFRAHDARRTLITNLLENGLSVKEVQQIARHQQASTTLIYAQTSDLKSIANKAKDKLGYADVERPPRLLDTE